MRNRPAFISKSLLTLLAVALTFTGASPIVAQHPVSRIPDGINEKVLVTLKGTVHPLAVQKNDRGTAAGSLEMNRMLLVLKRSDEQEQSLEAAIGAMHDPASPHFHQWLTPQEFGSVYGTSDEDIAKLSAWLQGYGFRITGVAQGRGTIEFSGTADQVGSAFHTSIHSYVVNGKQHYANATDVSIPASIAPVVVGVLSLNNFVKVSNAKVIRQVGFAATGPNGALQYTPDLNLTTGALHAVGPGDLWTIYDAIPLIKATSNAINGAGQTVAIVGRSDVTATDISSFRTTFLPAPYSTVKGFVQTINGPDPGIVLGDTLEQTLDVEYATAMAPSATVNLIVSGSTNTTDGVDLSAQYIVDNNLAAVMSTSYGLCEADLGPAGNQFYNQLWQQAAAQGITSMVSAGDNGSAACDLVGPSDDTTVAYVADEGLQVNGIASTPYDVAVGGNEFNETSSYWSTTNVTATAPLTTALSSMPEMVWNESCSPLVCGNANADIAGGSGGKSGCFNATFDANNNITSCSGGYAQPAWQAGVVGIQADGARHLPDVALTAAGHDGYAICFQGSCSTSSVEVVGGTSASTPTFAGIMALVNQKTGSRQGQANYTLYRLAAAQYGSAAAPNTANLTSCNASNGSTIGKSCVFRDVTAGTNAMPCDGGTPNCSSTTAGAYGVLTGYSAGMGYDNATGLGSVDVTNLVNSWNNTVPGPTSTALTLGATSSTFGGAVNLSVAVTPASGSGTPTGQVALTTDSTAPNAVGAGVVSLTNGAYSGTISSLPGGTYNVFARYAGDTAFSSSTSTGSMIVVSPAASTTKLALGATDAVTGASVGTASSAPYGSLITATATMTGVAGQLPPTGNVAFQTGTATAGTTVSDGTGVASYVGKGYILNTYSWQASYAGNNNYNASASNTASITIVQAPTSVQLLTSTSYLIGSNAATLTAVVLTDSFLSNPTGSISFTVNGTAAGTVPVSAYVDPSTGVSEGKAKFSLTSALLSVGANTVTATYSGDGNYAGSTSYNVAVGYSATAGINKITLAASSTAVSLSQPVALTATVTTNGIASTAGTVNFFDGAVKIGTAQVVGSNPAKGYTTGTAVLKEVPGAGTHNFTATYMGLFSAPAAVTSTVVAVTASGKAASTIAVAGVPNATVPSNYDLTATVTGYGLSAPTLVSDFAETTVAQDFGTSTIDPTTTLHTFLSPALNGAGAPKGAAPNQSIAIDVNGDGILDIVTANASFNGSTMSVLIGNGDGTFKAAATYTAGVFATTLSSGDFNGDGVVDFVLTNQYNSTFSNGVLSVFLGNGDGTFRPQIAINLPGLAVNSAVADFNGDGILDIAALQIYPAAQIDVLYGNGDGTFAAPLFYSVKCSLFSPYAIAAADFNGDGAPDVVEVNSSDKTAGVFLNSGNGVLVASTYLATGTSPEWVIAGDLNADGRQDIVVANYTGNVVNGTTIGGSAGVFVGNGDGTFQTQVSYPMNGYVSALTLADLNGDGKPDLSAAFYTAGGRTTTPGIGVRPGNGDGTFGAETDYATGQIHTTGVTAADLNGDGTLDLVGVDIGNGDVLAQDVAVLLNVTQAAAVKQNVTVAGALGVQQEVVASYAGDPNYNSSSSAGIYLKSGGIKANPVIFWNPASTWGAGVALGSSVLNAAIASNLQGSFTYTAATGTGAAVPVTVASSLVAGSYTLTATFTPIDSSDYATVSATRAIAIVPSDFTLETSAPSVTIVSGQSGSFTATAVGLYGFTGQIALTPGSNLPGGFTFTSSPNSMATGGTATVTIGTTALPAQASLRPFEWKGWAEKGGAVLAFLTVIPFMRRRRIKLVRGVGPLVLLLALVTAGGCGVKYENPSVRLSSSSRTSANGTPLILTATLTDGHASMGGTVSFYNGTTLLGSGPVFVVGNVATLPIQTLPVGLNQLTAVYSGDGNNSGGSSPVAYELITGQTSVSIMATSGALVHATTVQVILQ